MKSVEDFLKVGSVISFKKEGEELSTSGVILDMYDDGDTIFCVKVLTASGEVEVERDDIIFINDFSPYRHSQALKRLRVLEKVDEAGRPVCIRSLTGLFPGESVNEIRYTVLRMFMRGHLCAASEGYGCTISIKGRSELERLREEVNASR